MKRICNKCKGVTENDRLMICPYCGEFIQEIIKDDIPKDQIDRIINLSLP